MSSVGSVRKVPPPPPDAQVQVVGEEVGGYVLGELLTQGGMASVYLGKRVAPGGFEKTVVFKRLRPELASQPALLALFLREASLSAALEHPSIVRTVDLAKLDGSYYLVMEYVRGGDLRLLLRRARRRGQRFSAAAALHIGRELLLALEYAHSRCTADGWPLGLSHRDVSPANILISAEGEVKLSDFGIAQASAEEGLGDIAGVRLRGKVGYMSPEQACGAQVDSRSDLFALSAVLYEVLTGKRLFIGQPGQPLVEIYQAAIVPPSQLCPELPAACDAVLSRALAARKEDRYQTAHAFYEALLDITRQHNLWLDHAGFAEHLRDICGPDASTWRVLEERTGTAIIPSLGESDEDGDSDSGMHGDGDREAGGARNAADGAGAGDKAGARENSSGRSGVVVVVSEHSGVVDVASDCSGVDVVSEHSGVVDVVGERGGAGVSDGEQEGFNKGLGRRLSTLASAGEPLSDHVITVPWPTVPDQELLPASGRSPDDTMPLPSAELTAVDEPLRRRPPASPAPAKDAASSSGSAILPVRSPARPAARVIEHALPPSGSLGIDLDAVTSPARLVDPTVPLTKATLPPLNDETVPPALNTAQVGLLSPLSASATNPMHRLPRLARWQARGRELFVRTGGWTGLPFLFLVLCGLAFTLWMAGAQVWSFVWTRLQGR